MDRCKIKTHRCKANTPLTGISPGFPLKLLFPMQLTVSSWDIAFLCLQEGTNQPPPCNFEIKYRTPMILGNSKMIKSSPKNPFMSKPSRHRVESSTIFLVKTIKCWTFLVIYGIVTSLKTHQNHRLSCSFLPQHYWQLTAVNYDICSFPTKPARSQRYPGLMKKHWHFSWQWCSLHHFFHRILAVFWLFFDHLKVMSELCFLPFILFLLSEVTYYFCWCTHQQYFCSYFVSFCSRPFFSATAAVVSTSSLVAQIQIGHCFTSEHPLFRP